MDTQGGISRINWICALIALTRDTLLKGILIIAAEHDM